MRRSKIFGGLLMGITVLAPVVARADEHLAHREWRKVKRSDQVAYFRWRHTHPDSVIFVVKQVRPLPTAFSCRLACGK